MKTKPAFLVPVLLVFAAAAQAQDPAACPQLPADAELSWEHRGNASYDFCRALRSDGSEAFGLYIAAESPFEPKRSNREEAGVIGGREIHWYRAELAAQPDITARETLIEFGDGRMAHVWMQTRSPEQHDSVLQVMRNLRFNLGGGSQVAAGN